MIAGVTLWRATIKYVPTYKCNASGCGRVAFGSTVTVELEGVPELDLTAAIASAVRNTRNTHMPLNWAGYGNNIHRCPEHKT